MKKYIRLVLCGTGIIFLVCLSTLIACNLIIVNNVHNPPHTRSISGEL
jgi:hypothetical protein